MGPLAVPPTRLGDIARNSMGSLLRGGRHHRIRPDVALLQDHNRVRPSFEVVERQSARVIRAPSQLQSARDAMGSDSCNGCATVSPSTCAARQSSSKISRDYSAVVRPRLGDFRTLFSRRSGTTFGPLDTREVDRYHCRANDPSSPRALRLRGRGQVRSASVGREAQDRRALEEFENTEHGLGHVGREGRQTRRNRSRRMQRIVSTVSKSGTR